MKKKLALLLAVVMAMSIIPMTAFGQTAMSGASVSGWITDRHEDSITRDMFEPDPDRPGFNRGVHGGWVAPGSGHTYLHNIGVSFPFSIIAGRGNEVRLVVRLRYAHVNTGDLNNAWWAPTATPASMQFGHNLGSQPTSWTVLPEGRGEGHFNLPFSRTTGGTVEAPAGAEAFITAVDTDQWSWMDVFVTIRADEDILSRHNSVLTFNLPVRGFREQDRWQNSTLSVSTAADPPHINIIENWRIAGQGTRAVSWSVPHGPRGFSSALHVPNIRLTENAFGVIEGDIVVRLEAPEFYTWSFGQTHHTTAPNHRPPIFPRTVTDRVAGRYHHYTGVTIVGSRPGITAPLSILRGGAGDGASFHDTLAHIGVESARYRGPDATANIHAQRIIGTHAAYRHVLYIHLGEIIRNPQWRPGIGFLEIANLWLVPDDHAQSWGDVEIDVEIGRFALPRPVGAPGDQPWHNLVGWGRIPAARMQETGQRATLHVGTRGTPGLTVEVHGGPNYVRTGHLGLWRPAGALVPSSMRPYERYIDRESDNIPGRGDWSAWQWNRDNEGLAHWSGVPTSTLLLEEDIAGGFRFGFGAPINFQFLDEDGEQHPGIRILGMEARAGSEWVVHHWRGQVGPIGYRDSGRNWQWERGEMTRFYRGSRGVPRIVGRWGGANQNWMTFSGWVGALYERFPSVSGVGRVTDTIATIYLPSQAITDVPTPGILEVRFWLSVEAGYEWKYGPEIDVTISGAGVASLFEGTGSYTTTIALAQDPIVVSHDPPIQLQTGALHNIIGGRQALNDVIIDVVNRDAFGIGNEIWLYIATDTVGRNLDLNIAHIPTVTVNAESGLRLDGGRLANPNFGNWTGREAIVFTVTRQPYGGGAPAPEIIISNLAVEGTALPGVDYHLVISGTGVANNDQEVYARLASVGFEAAWTVDFGLDITWQQFMQNFLNVHVGNRAIGARMGIMNRGVYTTLPYYAVTLQQASGGIDYILAQPGGRTDGPIMLTDTTMWNYNGTEIRAMMWREFVPGFNTAGISARVFTDIVGGTSDWDGTTATFVIPGLAGSEYTVQLTPGNPSATVNGQTVDIASRSAQPGLAGQVSPINDGGRVFVPARFLATIAGVPISGDGHTLIIG